MRSSETINLGDEFEIDAGAQQVMARFSENSPNTVLAALPFATVAWRGGNSTVSYRMATAPSAPNQVESQAAFYLPQLSMRDGQLALEHGMHQEIGWERRTDASGVSFLVYSDHITNPVIEASGRVDFSHGVLSDPISGLMRGAGQNYSSAGVMAAVEHRLAGGNLIRVSYANGDALVMPATRASDSAEPAIQRRKAAARADVCDLSFRNDGGNGNALARKLSLAACRHGHIDRTIFGGCNRAVLESAPAPADLFAP